MSKQEKTSSTDSQRITTPEFRVSYPHVFEPSGIRGSTPKYSIEMIFKKTANLSALKLAMKHAKIEKFGIDPKNWPSNLENPVKDGDTILDKETGEPKEEYRDAWVVKASSNQEYKPIVVDEDVEPILDKNLFYPGCFAIAQVYVRVWEFANKQGIHLILDMVQKTRDGKPMGGKRSAKEVFAPIHRQTSNDDGDDDSEDAGNFM